MYFSRSSLEKSLNENDAMMSLFSGDGLHQQTNKCKYKCKYKSEHKFKYKFELIEINIKEYKYKCK